MSKRSNKSRETAKRLKETDPDYFKKLGKAGAKARKKPYYHFKELAENDPAKLTSISSQAGKKSRRGKDVR